MSPLKTCLYGKQAKKRCGVSLTRLHVVRNAETGWPFQAIYKCRRQSPEDLQLASLRDDTF